MQLLYYVAVPCTEEVLNLITLFSINSSSNGLGNPHSERLGLFIYRTRLSLESVDNDTEWLLDVNDALQVLVLYADRDFNSICEYLNTIPNKPFDVYIDESYLNHRI